MSENQLDYTSPVSFSLKQRAILALAPPIAAAVLKSIYSSCKVEISGEDHWNDLKSSGHFLIGFWHEVLAIVASLHKGSGYHTLTSLSFDGELAARMVNSFGLKALRGSSSRGGLKALAQLTLATESIRGVGLTLDGPKGPRRTAKRGLAYLAARTQLPMITVAATATPAWRAKSWDRLAIPRPFSTIRIAYGAPIPPPRSLDADDVEAGRRQLEESLNALHAELDDSID